MRPDWDAFHMASAFLTSFRSPDSESKVGAVIVNSKNREIGRGYNGFPSQVDEKGLDTYRPGKYIYMCHAEENGVSNLTIKPDKASIYVTRMPCGNCSKLLWQNNIREWFVPLNCVDFADNGVIKNYSKEENKLLNLLLKSGLVIKYVDFGIDNLKDLVSENQSYFSYLD
jgi:dCMP deaminase